MCVCVCVGKTTKCTNLRCSKGCGNHKSPFDVRRSLEGLRQGNLIKKVRPGKGSVFSFRFWSRFLGFVCLSLVLANLFACQAHSGGRKERGRKGGLAYLLLHGII